MGSSKTTMFAVCVAMTIAKAGAADAATLDDMIGKWKWTDFTIEVTKCATNPSGAGLCGKVIAGPKNVGMEMIRSKLEGKGDAFVGRIAHPMTSDIYNTRMRMTKPDTWSMDGCTDSNVCAKGDFVRVK